MNGFSVGMEILFQFFEVKLASTELQNWTQESRTNTGKCQKKVISLTTYSKGVHFLLQTKAMMKNISLGEALMTHTAVQAFPWTNI